MINALISKYLYPFYETSLKGRKTFTYYHKLLKNQWLPKQELDAIQWAELKKLLNHAYTNSSWYRESFDKLGLTPNDINSWDDFYKLPVVGRDDLIANFDGMIADNYRDGLIVKSTGGSTGVPVRLGLDRNSHEWRTAVAQRGYSWAHCEFGRQTVYIWSGDVGKPGFIAKLKNTLYQKTLGKHMINSFQFGPDEMRETLAYINKHKPDGIVAFTTPLYNFAQFICDNNLNVEPGAVKGIITGAEKLYDHQRELIEEVFGIRMTNTYGCREVMLIASECEKHEGLHVNTDSLVVEILVDGRPANPGESGEIVITDLHNFGMPLIRYKNGDIATATDHVCSCGRGFPLIKDVEGRKLDVLLATDGRKFTGAFFPHLMKDIKSVRKYQVIQKTTHLLHIKLVTDPDYTPENEQYLRNDIHKVAGKDMELRFDYVDDIPLTTSGKYRTTISEIATR